MDVNRKRKLYEVEVMEQALNAVKSGKTINAVSREFSVPRSTLHSKVMKIYKTSKNGPPTVFNEEEENALEKWILQMSRRGCPITKEHLINSVAIIVKKSGKETPFINHRPGRHWYEGFLQRHPQISKRISENVSLSRSLVSETSIRKWFSHIKTFLEKNNILHIDGSRIFNSDETAVLLNPKGGAVLTKKGSKTVYNVVNNNEKENLTVLVTGNASGSLAPTLILMKYKRVPAGIYSSLTKEYHIGHSDSGWMTSEIFFEYIANRFYPWIVDRKIQLPVLLYLDGHASHLSESLCTFCYENQIHLILLPPNSTHILQLMDISFFAALKSVYKNYLNEYRIQKEILSVKKEDFAVLLEAALKNMDIHRILSNGFRVCGLSPFNVNAVDFSRVFIREEVNIEQPPQEQNQMSSCDEWSIALTCLEKYIDKSKLKDFRAAITTEWTGANEDKNLFHTWRKMYLATTNNSENLKEFISLANELLESPSGIDYNAEDILIDEKINKAQSKYANSHSSSIETLDIAEEQNIENMSPTSNISKILLLNNVNKEEIFTDNDLHFKIYVDDEKDRNENSSKNMESSFVDCFVEPGCKVKSQSESNMIKSNFSLQNKHSNGILQEIQNLNKNVSISEPSAQQFHKYLYFPVPKTTNKKKIQPPEKRRPSILSSEEARDFFREKLQKKEQLENEKEARKLARLEKSKIKKELKEAAAQKQKNNKIKKKEIKIQEDKQ